MRRVKKIRIQSLSTRTTKCFSGWIAVVVVCLCGRQVLVLDNHYNTNSASWEMGVMMSSILNKEKNQNDTAGTRASTSTITSTITSTDTRPSRISYQLWRKNTFTNMFTPFYQCREEGMHALHPAMKETLDFTTIITTNLKVLVLGDSVGVQIAQGLQEAAGGANLQRSVLRYTSREHEGLFVAETRGGGFIAGWRITALLARKGENKALPNSAGGGWTRSDAYQLLRVLNNNDDNFISNTNNAQQQNQQTPQETENTLATSGGSSFDVLVMRIPHGWIRLADITEAALRESIELAQELFGMKHVILLSLPLNNNVVSIEDYYQLQQVNTMLKSFVQSTRTDSSTDGVLGHVLLLDFGQLGDALTRWNAQLLGMNTTATTSHDTDYLLEHLASDTRKGITLKYAQVCNPVFYAQNYQACNISGNGFSLDGQHWCSESLNGRIHAGIACLIQCLYPATDDNDEGNDDGGKMVQVCAKECNERFMTLRPVTGFVDV